MERLVGITEVESQVALKKSTLYELMALGQFPAPIKVGRASRWLVSEVQAWIDERASQRKSATAAVSQS